MSIRQTLKNDYSLSVFAKLLTAAVGVASSAFSTRYLGVAFKGDAAYVSHVAGLLALLLNLGVYQSYAYNYRRLGKGVLKKYADLCFSQFFLLLLLAGGVTLVWREPMAAMVALLAPLSVLKTQLANICLVENLRFSLWVTVIGSVLNALGAAGLYFLASPSLLYIVLLTAAVDGASITLYCAKLRAAPRLGRVDGAFVLSVLKFGFLPMLSGLLATVNYSVDILFLKALGDQEELSYYALAAGILHYVWLIPDALKSVLLHKSARKLDMEHTAFSVQASMAFTLLCLVGFALAGPFLLRLVYGAAFAPAWGVTLLLMAGAFAMAVYKVIGVVLMSQGKRRAHFACLAVSAAVNGALNALLIPLLGMYGAGLASVCSYTVCGGALLLYFCRLYAVSPRHLLIPSRNLWRRIRAEGGK